MKPLLIAATLTLSIAGVSGSTPALAETVTTFGVATGGGYFDFFDDKLNSSFSPGLGFATLGVALKMPEHTDLNVHFLNVYMDADNPFASNPGATITEQTYYYSVYPSGEPHFEREQYTDPSLFWFYISQPGDGDWYIYENVAEGYSSTDPFDRDELRAVAYSALPLSTFGIFDFENSFVYYAGESEGVSLAHVFAQLFAPDQPVSPGVSIVMRPKENNFGISWVDDREIVAISLTYNLSPVPEPETWAMLLAGLGVVSVVTRRRRAKAVT
ncbi:MAG: PEPxxWA-CTERM sorting domain-containing protein [Azoarcus sp.]|jgi:hypothetical protein|nr:PEPxxWA-CTERM sorting domain-containing protein [Azoarcus sp.]